MRNFLVSLMNRQIGLDRTVLPRTRGRFEPDENAAAVYLPPHRIDKSDHLRPATSSAEKKSAKDESANQNPTLPPVNEPTEPTKSHREAAGCEIMNKNSDNPSPAPINSSVPDASVGIVNELRTSVSVSPLQESVRHHDKPVDDQAANHKADVKTGFDGTIQNTLKPFPETQVKSPSTPLEKPNNTSLKTTASFNNPFQNQRFDRYRKQSNENTTDSSVNTEEIQPDIIASQPHNAAFKNAGIGTVSGLENPTFLSRRHVDATKTLSGKSKNDGHESVIKVTIGRIDVRAVTQNNPLKPRRVATPKPKMSLDDYLKKRGGDQR